MKAWGRGLKSLILMKVHQNQQLQVWVYAVCAGSRSRHLKGEQGLSHALSPTHLIFFLLIIILVGFNHLSFNQLHLQSRV